MPPFSLPPCCLSLGVQEVRQAKRAPPAPLARREPPEEGLMCEMLWSDPQDEPGRQPNKRGVGVAFGASPPLLLSAPARSFCLAQPTRAPPACLAATLALSPGGRPPPQQQQISHPGA